MTGIRKVREFDGVCTVFVGSGLIISGLSDAAADAIALKFERPGTPEPAGAGIERGRRAGRFAGAGPASRAVRRSRRDGGDPR